MAEKKTKTKSETAKVEQEYIIPLRSRFQHVARYKKTPKAIKTIKEFLVKHMKIYDRDLKKIKLEKEVNEYIWARGIKNPPHQIKVKAIKVGEIVKVELVDLPDKLKYKKLRHEKREQNAKVAIEKKKSFKEKALEGLKTSPKSEDTLKSTDENKDGVEDKKEVAEKQEAVKEAGEQIEKDFAKKEKHLAKAQSGKEKLANKKGQNKMSHGR